MSQLRKISSVLIGALMMFLLAVPPHSEAARGGGGKVTVTAAEPAEAEQGQEMDVYISGDGFDEGSTATFYVSGTSDASQIIVDSTVYEEATGRLKSRIRVNGSAVVTDYDIEVQNSGGRRGKGTTLFKVQQAETECTGSEDPSPSIVYETGLDTSGDIWTTDFYLTSESGCDRYLLLEDAKQFDSTASSAGEGEIVQPYGLRIDTDNGLGIAIWHDIARLERSPLYGLMFNYANSQVQVDPLGPVELYDSPDHWEVRDPDVRFDEAGAIELAIRETEPVEEIEGRLVYVRIAPDGSVTREVLQPDGCVLIDLAGRCHRIRGYTRWSEDGSTIYFTTRALRADGFGERLITRISRVNGVWQEPEVLVSGVMNLIAVRSDDLLSYQWNKISFNKRGKEIGSTRVYSIIDPESCSPIECLPPDGYEMSITYPDGADPGLWTRDGGMLYQDNVGGSVVIKKLANPLTGEAAAFHFEGTITWNYRNWDTSF